MTDKSRRDQILEVTLDLLNEKGFANVSTRDLADRAGLSRSHIYHYFKDWPSLRQEAFLAFSEKQLLDLKAIVSGLPPLEAVQAYVLECIPEPGESGIQLWLDAWDEAIYDSDLAEVYANSDSRWRNVLEEIIEQGLTTGDFHCASAPRAARQIFTMTMGYADEVILRQSTQARDLAFAEVVDGAMLLLGRLAHEGG